MPNLLLFASKSRPSKGRRSPKMPTLHVQAGSSDDLQEIADYLWKAKKIVVITGAGISTNSGIPVSVSKPSLSFLHSGIADELFRTFDRRMACIL